MKAGSLKSPTLLFPLTIITILILLLFAGIAIYEARQLATISREIYNHPLMVSNATRDIASSINAMHRSMKDVVLADTPEQMDDALRAVDIHEKKALEAFAVIRKRFLGDKKRVETAQNDFKRWKTIRNEVVALMRQGRRAEAAAITNGRGVEHIRLINYGADGNSGLHYLADFANRKAMEFQTMALQKESRAHSEIFTVIVLAVF